MQQEEFIDGIKARVVDGSIEGIESILREPPGRKPSPHLIELSKWYNGLNSQDKIMIRSIIKESVELSTFSFFCILDHVSTIEPLGEKGNFFLKFEKNGTSVWLNDPDKDFLHDLMKAKFDE